MIHSMCYAWYVPNMYQTRNIHSSFLFSFGILYAWEIVEIGQGITSSLHFDLLSKKNSNSEATWLTETPRNSPTYPPTSATIERAVYKKTSSVTATWPFTSKVTWGQEGRKQSNISVGKSEKKSGKRYSLLFLQGTYSVNVSDLPWAFRADSAPF